MMMRLIAVSVWLLFTADAFAYHPSQCWKTYTKSAMLGKYEYKYSSWDFISSKTSTEEGFSQVSSMSMTQHSRLSVDPGVTTTGASQSQTEFTSSKGDCSVWAGLLMRREKFIAANLPAIKREIAYGDGEMLRSLVYLSGCSEATSKTVMMRLQASFQALDAVDNVSSAFSEAVDNVMARDAEISRACLSVST